MISKFMKIIHVLIYLEMKSLILSYSSAKIGLQRFFTLSNKFACLWLDNVIDSLSHITITIFSCHSIIYIYIDVL